jgi:hypothetical protein
MYSKTFTSFFGSSTTTSSVLVVLFDVLLSFWSIEVLLSFWSVGVVVFVVLVVVVELSVEFIFGSLLVGLEGISSRVLLAAELSVVLFVDVILSEVLESL